jgi:hypothetical protein
VSPSSARFALLLPVLLGACVDKTDTRRWYSARTDEAPSSAVKVNVYASPGATALPADPLSQLSDAGQVALIKAITERTRTLAELRAALAAPLMSPPASRLGQPVSDRVTRLLVATLSRPGDYRPGDRIMRAIIHVRALNFTFGGYTIAQTDRKTVDVTAVTRNSTNGASLTLSPGPTAIASPIGGSLGFNTSQVFGTSTRLRENPESLTVDIVPSCLSVVREGSHGADLTGNTLISLTTIAETAPTTVRCGLLPGDPSITPTDARRQPFWVIGPDLAFTNGRPTSKSTERPGGLQTYPTVPLEAQIVLDFELRRVESGGEYYDEGEHAVARLKGRSMECQTLVDVDQLMPPLYTLVRQGRGRLGETVNLQATADTEEIPVLFTDFETAKAAAAWVNREHPTRLGALRRP